MANSNGTNQYTAAKAAGITPEDANWPKQAETRRETPEEVRAQIRASVAIHFLQSLVDDPSADTGHKVSASKILLDKTVASLSSVDQTVRDERELDDPEKVEARLRMLIAKAEPALLSRILGERARQAGDTPSEVMSEVGERADPDAPKQRNIGA